MPLKIHFLNVGHGDCTFIELPSGRLTMVDINNSTTLPDDDESALALQHSMSVTEFKSASSMRAAGGLVTKSWEDYYRSLLVDPVDYYREHFDGQSIFRYIQTHPDLDHMSGLFRFFWQEKISLVNFWDTAHTKVVDEEDCEASPFDYANWVVYTLLRQGHGPDDSTHKVLKRYRGDTGEYWNDDDIHILSPTPDLVAECNERDESNDLSYILKITYGGRTVILPGDAEKRAWGSILDHYSDADLDCEILKASHHGRRSGYHEAAVRAMDPELVVCSVGKKPSTDASLEYARQGAQVLSTRFHGTITATMWFDGEVWVDNHKGERIASLPIL
jgi:competence protein ComEC